MGKNRRPLPARVPSKQNAESRETKQERILTPWYVAVLLGSVVMLAMTGYFLKAHAGHTPFAQRAGLNGSPTISFRQGWMGPWNSCYVRFATTDHLGGSIKVVVGTEVWLYEVDKDSTPLSVVHYQRSGNVVAEKWVLVEQPEDINLVPSEEQVVVDVWGWDGTEQSITVPANTHATTKDSIEAKEQKKRIETLLEQYQPANVPFSGGGNPVA